MRSKSFHPEEALFEIEMPLPERIPYNPRFRMIVYFVVVSMIIQEVGSFTGSRLFAAASMILLAFSALLTLRRLLWPRYLTLADDSMTVPSGFLGLNSKRIGLEGISRVWVNRISSSSILCVKAAEGRIEISDIFLPDSVVFDSLKRFLESKVRP